MFLHLFQQKLDRKWTCSQAISLSYTDKYLQTGCQLTWIQHLAGTGIHVCFSKVLSKCPALAQCPTDSLVEPDCKQTDLNLTGWVTLLQLKTAEQALCSRKAHLREVVGLSPI